MKTTQQLGLCAALMAVLLFSLEVPLRAYNPGGRAGGGRPGGGGGLHGGGARPGGGGGARPGGGINRPSGGGINRPSGGINRPSGGGHIGGAGINRPGGAGGGINRPGGNVGNISRPGGNASRPNFSNVSRPTTPVTRPGGGGSGPSLGGIGRPDFGGNRPGGGDRPNIGGGNRPTLPDRPNIGGGNRPDRPTLPDRPGGGDRPTFPNRPDRPNLPDRPGGGGGDRPTFPNRPDRPNFPDRPGGGGDRPSFPNRPDRPNLPDRPGGGGDRPTFPNRPDRPDRPILPDRPGAGGGDRPIRPDFPNRPGPDRPVRPDRPIIGGGGRPNRPIIGGGNNNNINIGIGINRPGWNGGWGWHPGNRYPWYNGAWSGHWGNNWYRPPATFFVGWGLGSWNSSYTNITYVNPYVGTTTAAPYDYSQPVVINNYVDSSADAGATSTAVSSDNERAMTLFNNGLEDFRTGMYPPALTAFDDALKLMPGDPVLHEMRALTLFAMGKFQAAAAVLDSLLASSPGMDWTTLSGLYGDINDYTRQLRALEAYIEANPNDASARFVLAYHYLVMGHTEDAIDALKTVVKLQPKDVTAQQLLKTLSASSEPPATTTTPPDADAPKTDLVGRWRAKPTADTVIDLEITEDSQFTWKATPKGGKAVELQGDLTTTNDLLVLETTTQGSMVGQVRSGGADKFQFIVSGGPPDDKGLAFERLK